MIHVTQEVYRVHTIYLQARPNYAGNRVESLVAYVQSEEPAPANKSRVIKILGKLQNTRALPLLVRLCTRHDQVWDHNRRVCQREIKKAIDKLTGKMAKPPYLWYLLLKTVMPDAWSEMLGEDFVTKCLKRPGKPEL